MDIKENLMIWEKIFSNSEWGKYPPISLVRFMAKNYYPLLKENEVKVLEIGCGPGANLWYLAREGFSVYGIDGSSTAIKKANERLKYENLTNNVKELLVGDYMEVIDNFSDKMFDVVVDIESLSCNPFEYSRKVIEKIFNKLKSGGLMFSITFTDRVYGIESMEEVDYHGGVIKDGPLSKIGFFRYTSFADIKKLYKLHNNRIVSIEREDYIFDIENNKGISEWLITLQKQ